MNIHKKERSQIMFDNIEDCMAKMLPVPQQLELARAYIPFQQYTVSFSPQVALERGTMFPELYRPYEVNQY